MKHLNFFLSVILMSTFLTMPILSQSEQGYILGIKNFEKSFPSDNTDWDSFDNLCMDMHYDGNFSQQKLNLNTNKIIGQEMIYDFDLFTVEMIINSNSAFVNRGANSKDVTNKNTKTIHLDNHRSLVSWLEDDNTYVTMYADFQEGQTSAFLYKDDGSITPVSGSIKMKK